MIVVKIGDGMGNQLFNYACGYAAARRDGDFLTLDTSECDNSTLRRFELDNFHLKYEKRISFSNRTALQKIYKRVRRNLKYHVIMEREVYLNRDGKYAVDDIDPRVFEKKKLRDKYLLGYWQHLPYFEEYLEEICAMLTPAYAQSSAVRKCRHVFSHSNTCAIHVRGGDIGGPDESYFYRAAMQMEERAPGVYYLVFTNDRKKAMSAIKPVADAVGSSRLTLIEEFGEFSDVDEFFLMASCRNQILSNSTYSTWAAYLNPFPQKTVVMPEDILSERMKQKDWIIV